MKIPTHFLHGFQSAASHARVTIPLASWALLSLIEHKRNNKSCRVCHTRLSEPFLDLGTMPLANSYVKPESAGKEEPSYPLRVFFCEKCQLVQLVDFLAADQIFNDYAYFSSFSSSWLEHSKRYADAITPALGLNEKSQVVEIASNDGYLLQYFQEKNIPVLGIEPSITVAEAAMKKGIVTWVKFFGVHTAREMAHQGRQADLLIGNNVFAHVPDTVDFVRGLKIALKPEGVITLEFPHLLRLMEDGQFDTIYHEHFSYFSLLFVNRLFESLGLTVYDVEQLPTHGGSLRVYACHSENAARRPGPRVLEVLRQEHVMRLSETASYEELARKAGQVKMDLLAFLQKAKKEGKKVVGYGAPAKGNTLLNFCGIGRDLIRYTVDKSPHKQNHLLPGSQLPVYDPSKIFEDKPDYVLILPWNLKEEIAQQMREISRWGGRWVTAIPQLTLFG